MTRDKAHDTLLMAAFVVWMVAMVIGVNTGIPALNIAVLVPPALLVAALIIYGLSQVATAIRAVLTGNYRAAPPREPDNL